MPFYEKVLLTVLLLASLIFVHELGHFLVAKLFRVKVLKFSLGFGPRLTGLRWGETEYLISAIPLGGYVKMAGDDPNEPISEADRPRAFLGQPPWKRALIALAGPGMNLLFPILVYFVAFYFQTTEYSSRLGHVIPDQPAYAAGMRAGDRVISIDGEPVQTFSELRDRVTPKWGQEMAVTFERMGKVQTVRLVPERVEEKNPIETEVRGVIGVSPVASAPIIAIADPSSPAARAGLTTFSRIVKVAGQKVETYPQLEAALAAQNGPVSVSVLPEIGEAGAAGSSEGRALEVTLTPGGRTGGSTAFGIESTELYLFKVEKGSPAWAAGMRPGDRLLEVNGTALKSWSGFERARQQSADQPLSVVYLQNGKRVERSIQQRWEEKKDELGSVQRVLVFGAERDVRDSSFLDGEKIPYRLTAVQAMSRALHIVPVETRRTGLGILAFVRGKLGLSSLGGPLMMGDIAVRAAQRSWESFLEVMALISINLGLMNLIPIPVLDGFHILSAGFEGVRRKPIPVRARTIANYIGIALLLALMISAITNDIFRYFVN
jgi:regulator of sigma E protease